MIKPFRIIIKLPKVVTTVGTFLGIAKHKSNKKQNLNNSNYSNFDYESLTELYFKNKWLRNEVNHTGLESLWFDYDDVKSKNILFKLLNNFTYLTNEDAAIFVRDKLIKAIKDWSLNPKDTLFIGFRKHKFPDGSEILLNFFKSLLVEINPDWKEYNLLPDFHYGIRRIKVKGFKDEGLILKNIVLVDDFIGTGGTAFKNVEHIKNLISSGDKDLQLNLFSLAAMSAGLKKIEPLKIQYITCSEQEKAVTSIWSSRKRKKIRRRLIEMEGILFEGKEPEPLQKFSLGYGKSEALYAWSRFNIPNNNLPIFWWNRYSHGGTRKPMFNRMQ